MIQHFSIYLVKWQPFDSQDMTVVLFSAGYNVFFPYHSGSALEYHKKKTFQKWNEKCEQMKMEEINFD